MRRAKQPSEELVDKEACMEERVISREGIKEKMGNKEKRQKKLCSECEEVKVM